MLSENNLCMGCMQWKRKGSCPTPAHCGWIEGTRNPSQFQLQPRAVIQQRYLIGKVLGQGGFGITYLSFDLEKQRKVAIKEYFPSSFATRKADHKTVTHSNPESRDPYDYGLRKFAQEARTLARLCGHPNILAVLDFIEANQTGYIVMEYLDGITLANYLEKQDGGTLSFEQSLNILVPVMDALREVHGAHITHRDVSPDNIMLCRSGQVKLIDFGAAKEALRDPRTQQLILKAGYTPWEQYLTDGVAGPWTDIYSLAATIYRCITGVVPPEAPIRLGDPNLTLPHVLGAKLPDAAESALIRALAVRANDRYQTIAEFQSDLASNQYATPPDRPKTEAQRTGISHAGRFKRFQTWWIELLMHLRIHHSQPVTETKVRLRFTAGDEIGETVDVGKRPIIIGRDPGRAHLVLDLPQISAAHVKVSSDPARKGLRIEDLHSRNGTYVRKATGGGLPFRLTHREVLTAGDQFFLCDRKTATFEVIDL